MDQLLSDWGIWFLPLMAVAVMLTALVPPLPSEILVIGSGAMAADGMISLAPVAAVTIAACAVGDLVLYTLVRYRLIRVLYRWKVGRRLHRGVLRVTIRAGRTSTWVGLLLIRWAPGGRAASMSAAGVARMTWPHVLALTAAGALSWSAWLIGLGYITGTTTGLPPFFSTLVGVGVGTLVGLGIALLTITKRRARTQVNVAPS